MPECQGCGEYVTNQFIRVFGDNNDEVHQCINCSTKTNTRRRHEPAQ